MLAGMLALSCLANLSFASCVLAGSSCCANEETERSTELRINRAAALNQNAPLRVQPRTTFWLPQNITERWLFNLSSPSFCKMVLCNGSCTDPFLAALPRRQTFARPLMNVSSPYSAEQTGTKSLAMPGEDGDICPADIGCRLRGLFN